MHCNIACMDDTLVEYSGCCMLHAMCKLVDKYLCIIKEMHGVTP